MKIKPSDAAHLIKKCIDVGVVPFIQSSPGIGKSSIIRKVSDELSLEIIDLRLSMCSPEDLNGLPRFIDGKAEFQPFSLFPLKGTIPPPGKFGWLLFLDEFTSASRSVQAAAYKLILDRCVGNHDLSEKVHIVTAGNFVTDSAITTQMSSAMQSRLVSIEMKHDLDGWLDDVAYPEHYDDRLIAFMQFSPDSLMRFDPEIYRKQSKSFSCPRSWEFVNKIIKGEDSLDRLLPLILGSVDENDAYAFHQFTLNYKLLPDIDSILSSKHVDVPDDSALQISVIAMLISYVDSTNLNVIKRYIDKFPVSMKVVFLKSLRRKDISFLTHPCYIELSKEIGLGLL